MDKKLKQLKEAWEQFEEAELEEKLTPKERRKKQSKNMGLELEFASVYSPGVIEASIDDLVKEYFGDNYSASSDESSQGGVERIFEVTSDDSAALRGGGEEVVNDIVDTIMDLYKDNYNAEEIREEVIEDAKSEIDEKDYEDEEDYETAIEEYIYENIGKKESQYLENFLDAVVRYISSEHGSQAGDVIFDRLRKIDLFDLDGGEVEEIVMEMAVDGYLETGEDSYEYGVEIITPRLMLSDDVIERLGYFFEKVSEFGKTHDGAGLHVHVGITEGMNFVHLLRIAYYFDNNNVAEVAGRDFNHWAQSNSKFYEGIKQIVDSVQVDSNSQEYAFKELNELVGELTDSRYKVANFLALGKGTLELRIASSTIVDRPELFIRYMGFVKDALDYGLDEDYLQIGEDIKLYITDRGEWKITKSDKLIASSALVDPGYSKDKKVKIPTIATWEEDKIFDKIIKYLTKNPQALKRLQANVKKHFDKLSKKNRKLYGDDRYENHYRPFIDTFTEKGNLETLKGLTKSLITFEDLVKLLKAGTTAKRRKR